MERIETPDGAYFSFPSVISGTPDPERNVYHSAWGLLLTKESWVVIEDLEEADRLCQGFSRYEHDPEEDRTYVVTMSYGEYRFNNPRGHAFNWGNAETPNWHIEGEDSNGIYRNYKQSQDGGTVRVIR